MGIDIQEHISHNFQENIQYFEHNHPDLLQKLSSYETALKQGYYSQRYSLVYENNQFEIIELETNTALYNHQSNLFLETFDENIDYSTQDNCFTLIQTTKETPTTTAEFAKHIFFGIGLGLQLPLFIKMHTPEVLLIVEDDLELFYNSLFTINYKTLACDVQLFFSVFEERELFLQISKKFLNCKSYLNNYIKFFLMLHHQDNKISEFQFAITTQPHRNFSYKDLLDEMLKPINNILTNYPFLDASSSFAKIEKPFLLLAAGPSLQKNLQWIQKHQNSFTIVAVSAILAYLQSHNIKVDLALHLDTLGGASKHFNKIKSWEYFSNTLLLFSSKSDAHFLKKLPKKNLILFEVGTSYLTHSLKPSAPCVGSFTYQLLLLLKAQNIYLLGLDLAIDLQTGATHIQEHSYKKKLMPQQELSLEKPITYKETLLEIEGNMSHLIKTTPHFFTSIEAINLSTHYFKQESQQIYNLSDGARFKQIDALQPEDIYINSQEDAQLILQTTHFTLEDEKRAIEKIVQAQDLLSFFATLKDSPPQTQNELTTLTHQIYNLIKDDEKLKKFEIYKVIDLLIENHLAVFYLFVQHNKILQANNFLVDNILQNAIEMLELYIKEVSRLCKQN